MPYNPFKKITDLPTITSGQVETLDDSLAIVDVSEDTTKSMTLDSFFISTLNGGTFIGSFSGSFEGDGSGITGVSGGWDGSHLGDSSITGSFIVSGSGNNVDFTEVENGVSGSFSGSFVGSFSGDGIGLTGLTTETASYVTASNVDGPHGMNSILSASYASSSAYSFGTNYALNSNHALSSSDSINSLYSLSSSNSINSNYSLTSSNVGTSTYAENCTTAETASYLIGGSGLWIDEVTHWKATATLRSTGSLFASDFSAADLTISESMSVGGQLRNDGRLAYEQGPRIPGPENPSANINIDYLNLDKGGWKSTTFGSLKSGSINYLYGGLDSSISNHNEKDPTPYTGSENIGQYFKIWFGPDSNTFLASWQNSQFKIRVSNNTFSLNGLNNPQSKVITCFTPISGSETGLNESTGIGSVCEIYQVGEFEYFGVATGPFTST